MSAHRLCLPIFGVIASACSVPLAPPEGGEGLGRGDACEEAAIVAFVNDPATSADALIAIGVYSRGARNVVAARDGADKLPGTADDVPFASVDAIDAVSQIGDSSMTALWGWSDGRCAAEVVFSPQPYASSHLARCVEEIDAAERSIDVAMYSFSDAGIRDALGRAVARGVGVRFVYESANEHRSSPKGTMSAALEDLGIEVRYVNKIMHNKFMIVDGPRTSAADAGTATLFDGSGNWSYSAGTKYDENSVFLQGDTRLVLQFQREFDRMWDNGRPLVWNESIPTITSLPVSDAELAAADGSEAVFSSANFRHYVSATYGPTFSRDGDEAVVATRLAEILRSAKTSIRVASGHFRSRPIAEAILEAAQANPALVVQVYLDQQEYTSEWTYRDDEEDYEACLAEGDDRCDEMGLYFGYLLVDAGIPVRYKTFAYRWDYTYAVQMHDKYLVVDDEVVATGSYNYSFNAEYDTFENVAIYTRDRYPALVDAFVSNHAALWETNRASGAYDALLDQVANGAGDVPLVFPSMALEWAEVDRLKDTIREACPAIDTDPYMDDPAHHTTCPR